MSRIWPQRGLDRFKIVANAAQLIAQAQETAVVCAIESRRITKHDQYRLVGVESLAQGRLAGLDGLGESRGGQQPE